MTINLINVLNINKVLMAGLSRKDQLGKLNLTRQALLPQISFGTRQNVDMVCVCM